MHCKSSNYTKKSPDAKIEEEVARLFLDQIHLEREVEKLKCELAHRCDFTTSAAWKLFNFRGIEYLS